MNKVKTDTDEFLRILGYNIIQARLNRGIYLPAVAKALNISVYTLSNIENGKYPHLNIETIYSLAECFRVDVGEFFEGV